MMIADTDVLIDFLKGAEPGATWVAAGLRQGLSITVISAFELWNGAIGSLRRERAVDELIDTLQLVSLTPAAAKLAAQLRYEQQRSGRTIPMADSLIAGICVSEQATLMTRNRKHFEQIPELRLAQM